MLVLTRKSNQSIMIGDDIEVSVLSIMGEKVRVGIQAPRDIPVFRKEVYLEIQQERAKEMAGANVRDEVDQALRKLREPQSAAPLRGGPVVIAVGARESVRPEGVCRRVGGLDLDIEAARRARRPTRKAWTTWPAMPRRRAPAAVATQNRPAHPRSHTASPTPRSSAARARPPRARCARALRGPALRRRGAPRMPPSADPPLAGRDAR